MTCESCGIETEALEDGLCGWCMVKSKVIKKGIRDLPALITTLRMRVSETKLPAGIDGALFRAQIEAEHAVRLLEGKNP